MDKADKLVSEIRKAGISIHDTYFIALCISVTRRMVNDVQTLEHVGYDGMRTLNEYFDK